MAYIIGEGLTDILIETYWNVNEKSKTAQKNRFYILIETYWNVNHGADNVPVSGIRNINRDILECKYGFSYLPDTFSLILIETYWNVNFLSSVTVQLTVSY